MITREKSRFNIDFFEFSFLVEACIPPRPIARSMFWGHLIDIHYHILTKEERANLFEWVNRNGTMQQGVDNSNEDCLLFNARFNPDNQYLVKGICEGNKKYEYECFKWQGAYHTSRASSIIEFYITEIKKI